MRITLAVLLCTQALLPAALKQDGARGLQHEGVDAHVTIRQDGSLASEDEDRTNLEPTSLIDLRTEPAASATTSTNVFLEVGHAVLRSFRAEEGLLYDTGHQLQTKDMVKVSMYVLLVCAVFFAASVIITRVWDPWSRSANVAFLTGSEPRHRRQTEAPMPEQSEKMPDELPRPIQGRRQARVKTAAPVYDRQRSSMQTDGVGRGPRAKTDPTDVRSDEWLSEDER
jgi:hypothetical protein